MSGFEDGGSFELENNEDIGTVGTDVIDPFYSEDILASSTGTTFFTDVGDQNQVSINNVKLGGSTDDLEWKQVENGTSVAYGSDGSYYEETADGTITQWASDGSIYQALPDGTVQGWDASGTYLGQFESSDIEESQTDSTDYSDPDLTDAEDGVYGDSYEWHSDWFYQEVDGYCGPTAVAIVVNEYFGEEINNPEYMVAQAYDLGLVEDISEGMYSVDILALLQSQDIPAELVHSSMDDLAMKLDSGYGVIATVDSGEIWGDSSDAVTEDDTSDHVLVVTEINLETGMVTLADPGTPDGDGLTVPISQFEDAWEDSDYEMIVTTESDPDLVGNEEKAGAKATGGRENLAIINLADNGRIG